MLEATTIREFSDARRCTQSYRPQQQGADINLSGGVLVFCWGHIVQDPAERPLFSEADTQLGGELVNLVFRMRYDPVLTL